MYDKMIEAMRIRPTAYMPNAYAFWEDAYISKQMLASHLNQEVDGATRKYSYVKASAKWIEALRRGGDLLDLGCGPGIYAELFDEAGFRVTGMDYSKRSIEYARASAEKKNRKINYVHQNYLSMSYEQEFDIITLIYCDFGVLAPDIRRRFLRKIYQALRPGGIFVLDAFTHKAFKDFNEQRTVSYENGGFWSPEEYVCVKCDCRYGTSVVLEQYNVITAETLRTYNLWNEMFDEDQLAHMLHASGFTDVSFYADVCGGPRTPDDKTICAIGRK